MTLTTIVSGGQTGVDIAALRAARAVGLATGGWMPKGWRTLAGAQPAYAILYGLREHAASDYPPRTHANVRDADATLRIAHDMESAGERCTWQGIVKHRKPHKSVDLIRADASYECLHYDTSDIARWIVESRFGTLNVAGNSERTAPGIEAFAETYLTAVFREVLRQRGR